MRALPLPRTETLGIEGPRVMDRPKKDPEELIQRGVRLVVETGRPIAEVSRDPMTQRATGERSERLVADERLLGVIETTHAANSCAYGHRKLWLARAGHDGVGRDRVRRLMREHGIQGANRRGSRGAAARS